MVKKLRAVGYCRTSGEGQRDNTSIPSQKDAIKAFCKSNDQSLTKFYVDESKSGSKIEGRDEFSQMITDAAKDQFDLVVVYKIDRLARNGVDILSTVKVLKSTFQVHTVSTADAFDTRNPSNVLMNHVQAGVAEVDRFGILDRTINGRISRAKEGKPWSGNCPVGRSYDKETGKWSISDRGRMIQEVFRRYLAGETRSVLDKEYGLSNAQLSIWTQTQLAGTYQVHFECKDIGIDETVPVPQVPELVSQEMLDKVKARLQHNRKNNRTDVRKYHLTGFVRCGECGKALTGQTDRGATYYRHKADGCSFKAVRGDQVEPAVLDYLYGAFIDQPNYDKAVERALPSSEHRQNLIKELSRAEKQLTKNAKAIDRLVDAIVQGADPSLLIGKQDQLKAEQDGLADRSRAIETELATMPSAEATKAAAMLTRLELMMEHQGKDWRTLSHDEIQKFLIHLFGPWKRGMDRGIFICKDKKGQIVATFKGQMTFQHYVVNGRPISKVLAAYVEMCNKQIKREFEMAMRKADEERRREFEALGMKFPDAKEVLKPYYDNE